MAFKISANNSSSALGDAPNLTRRFAVGGALALAAKPIRASAAGFPPGFIWGVAASAPQTESAAGRGRSIWDDFAARPGAIADRSNLAVCNQFETRYPEDLGLAANAGLQAFRFSVAWPRVQPTGAGAPDAAGLAFYDRLVDHILRLEMQPWPTLYHWDLPAALPGGWLNRDTAQRLADYAVIVGRRIGDRVPGIMVLNEPGVVAIMGHAMGQHAPGLRDRAAWAAAMHHQNLAQGLAIAALRASLPARPHAGPVKLGNALSLQPVRAALPGAEEAAAIWDAAWNRAYLDPLYAKGYPARFAPDLGRLIRPGDMDIIASRPDFLGVNYYDRMRMIPGPGTVLGATWGPSPPGTPTTGLGWAAEPDGLAEQLAILRTQYGNPELLITENGAAYPDPPPSGGVINDTARLGFLRGHLQAAAQAIAAGSHLRGFFAWTLTDNFEWAEGFGPRFGLVAVSRPSQARTPKASLAWYGACARANAVV
jgi:beta-glucosidase